MLTFTVWTDPGRGMLFNSTPFIAGFLPIVLAGFFIATSLGGRWTPVVWLVAASLFFYGWWDYRNLFILVPSVVINYLLGRAIGERRQAGRAALAWRLLVLGVALNLAAIAYFKYFNFLVRNIADLSGVEYTLHHILLPIGISFFTFQQIKFLVDRYTGKAPDQPDFRSYALFVTFFPHVIAGPIVQHDELLPQIQKRWFVRCSPDLFADGVALFLLGLAKKLILADQFSVYADQGFDAADAGEPISFFIAWGAAMGYTLQLYFDFSGYSDMAIGLARMFGLRFPLNFDSPYKAVNIVDFWRRWHMTLSRFLREYLYIPLGGNRRGPARRHVNLMATMLLGGLWHGAGWTFVVWGGLHGAFIVVNHLWHGLRRTVGLPAGQPNVWGRVAGMLVTFLAVVVAWVFFRAKSFAAASDVLAGMAGRHGALLPSQLVDLIPVLGRIATGVGVIPNLAGGTILGFVEMVGYFAIGLVIVFFTPHLHQVTARTRLMLLVPSFGFVVQKLLFAGDAAPFLYFQF